MVMMTAAITWAIPRFYAGPVRNDPNHLSSHHLIISQNLPQQKRKPRRKHNTMKLCLLVIAYFVTLVQGIPDPDQLPPQANVPQWVIDRLKEKAALRDDWVPKLKQVRKGAPSFDIDGTIVEIADLIPIDNLFSPGAEIIINNVKQAPKIFLYKSKTHPSVKVLLDDVKGVMKASKKNPDGKEVELVHVDGDTFAEFNNFDVDSAKLQVFELVSFFFSRKCAVHTNMCDNASNDFRFGKI